MHSIQQPLALKAIILSNVMLMKEYEIIVNISMNMTIMEWYYDGMTVKKVILYKGERDLASDSTDSFSQASEAHPPT